MEILLFGALLAFFVWRSNRKKQKVTLEAYQHALEYANAMNAALI